MDDPQLQGFLSKYVEQTLNGPGFAIYSPQEKEGFKEKLTNYFSDLIFDTLLQQLSDEQLKELQTYDLASKEGMDKITVMSASIPGFIFILAERFKLAADEVGKTGRIPDLQAEAEAEAQQQIPPQS